MIGRLPGTRVIKCQCGGNVTGMPGAELQCRYCGEPHIIPGELRPVPPCTDDIVKQPVHLLVDHVIANKEIRYSEIFQVAYPDDEEEQHAAREAGRHRSLIYRVKQYLKANELGELRGTAGKVWRLV